MEELYLKFPSTEDKDAVLDFKAEFLEVENRIPGSGAIEKYETYEKWLQKCIDATDPEKVPAGKVPATQYLTYRAADNRLVGMVQLRHNIDIPYLATIAGHIGDCIRPSERNKGYATAQIMLCAQKAKEMGLDKVLISCVETNTASEKSIIKSGGVADGTAFKEETGETFKRFWIYLDDQRPVLETERLILRNFTLDDIDDYFKYASNPNVGPRCGWQPYADKSSAKERLYKEASKLHQFAIVYKDTNQVIGSVELMNTKTERYTGQIIEPGSKEIGFVLAEEFWGKGIMPEAAKAVMKYAFETLDAPSIFISHAEPNTQSGRVQEKLGFKIVGRLENYREWIDGKMCASVMRKMTKNEWFCLK